LLSQRAKLEVRFAGITLIPRPIIAEPLAIAIAFDAARHRAVQAVSSASLRGPEFEAMTMHWFGQAGRAQVSVIQSVIPSTVLTAFAQRTGQRDRQYRTGTVSTSLA